MSDKDDRLTARSFFSAVFRLSACRRFADFAGGNDDRTPDFSKLKPVSALTALGHAFFSLSLGMGSIQREESFEQELFYGGPAAIIIVICSHQYFAESHYINCEPSAGYV
ncbi:hypothetical protein [Paenibacillus beijingensis]|uniref:hypothetical protein n=1 Tax=Paenibacillus beijingensis TaxID=1126833 RepID=UPI0009E52668|nr:hypothetical protein [Paenibacillus beijingensis]